MCCSEWIRFREATTCEPSRRSPGGCMCLWGGVNGSMPVEAGTQDQIRKTVKDTLEILAPDNGFILSPVDGIYDTSDRAERQLAALCGCLESLPLGSCV